MGDLRAALLFAIGIVMAFAVIILVLGVYPRPLQKVLTPPAAGVVMK